MISFPNTIVPWERRFVARGACFSAESLAMHSHMRRGGIRVKRILFPPLLLLLLAACASSRQSPARYAVVVDERDAARWEVEALVRALRGEVRNVDLVTSPSSTAYDAVVRLDFDAARGASFVAYEILSSKGTDRGRANTVVTAPLTAGAAQGPVNPVGRSRRDVYARAHPADRHTIAQTRGDGGFSVIKAVELTWDQPPAAAMSQLARNIARDLQRLR